MDNFKKLQNLALKVILFLVWFDLMCFALILAGNIFKWSFFNESIGGAFFSAFGLSLGALVALSILHIVLTLNIISTSIGLIAKEQEIVDSEITQKNDYRFRNIIIASVVGVFIIVGYQGVAEHNAAKYKVEKIEKQLIDVAQSTLSTRIIDLIEQDEKINKLYFVRDEMLLSLKQEARSITLLIPKEGQKDLVFYKITPWDYNKDDETTISKSLDHLFVPNENERKGFSNLTKNFKEFSVVNRNDIRAFYPITKDKKLKLILLLDTSRTVSGDYLMSRSNQRK
ncbi:MAG: hypothetical protein KJ915_02125 [Candidatus Omnitrophica bacterium]|nr:hypothetical protein [Candidatus Omnitrophota bacterium]